MSSSPDPHASLIDLTEFYQRVRKQSEILCEPLIEEDYVIQSMPDVSPPKWHLAHVSWFFETFVLVPFHSGYQLFNPQFNYLFNSYYQGIGRPFPRPQRGLLSRPSVAKVYRYRNHVDRFMRELLVNLQQHQDRLRIQDLIVLGLNHEQQHQELLMTDIKHIFAQNPLLPAYCGNDSRTSQQPAVALQWVKINGGETAIGHAGAGFHFDNEAPQHKVLLDEFLLANRPVTNAEYLQFINDGGYDNPLLWLADGWTVIQSEAWKSPLYWHSVEGQWQVMTLNGLQPLAADEPVCHISYYEADAYATWAGKRLPTEAEWERAAQPANIADGNFLEAGRYHPHPAGSADGLLQLYGDVWEWTRSPYSAYPGYRPPEGAIGEYNGKFMCNQMVLRGGSCVTPQGHLRRTYRNFFYPHNRWQFMGVRLARDA